MKDRKIDWSLAIIVGLLTLLFLLAMIVANTEKANASEGVGCATVEFEWNDTNNVDVLGTQVDEGVRYALVGHFLWIKWSEDALTEDSYDNSLSIELFKETESPVTLCTTHIPSGEVIEAKKTITTERAIVVVSVFEPHPTIADAWITQNGLVAL